MLDKFQNLNQPPGVGFSTNRKLQFFFTLHYTTTTLSLFLLQERRTDITFDFELKKLPFLTHGHRLWHLRSVWTKTVGRRIYANPLSPVTISVLIGQYDFVFIQWEEVETLSILIVYLNKRLCEDVYWLDTCIKHTMKQSYLVVLFFITLTVSLNNRPNPNGWALTSHIDTLLCTVVFDF